MAKGHKGVIVIRKLWIRSPLGGMIYYLLIFSFPRSVNKAKREIASATREVGNGMSQHSVSSLRTRFLLFTLLYAEYNVELIN